MLWPIRWSAQSEADMQRLARFLGEKSETLSKKTILRLIAFTEKLQIHPCLGEQLFDYKQTEVRRFVVDQYEIRYRVKKQELLVLRVWHTREQRP
ncbi:MAG TPA: type II toxin-antitoxin system RelE/ParE family toxin [Limnobacter sp.]|nr:type II toxin-antitoxin system RelE/ParE family toxin [Limnobacter sp.]